MTALWIDPNDRTSPRPCIYCDEAFTPGVTNDVSEVCGRAKCRKALENRNRKDAEGAAAHTRMTLLYALTEDPTAKPHKVNVEALARMIADEYGDGNSSPPRKRGRPAKPIVEHVYTTSKYLDDAEYDEDDIAALMREYPLGLDPKAHTQYRSIGDYLADQDIPFGDDENSGTGVETDRDARGNFRPGEHVCWCSIPTDRRVARTQAPKGAQSQRYGSDIEDWPHAYRVRVLIEVWSPGPHHTNECRRYAEE